MASDAFEKSLEKVQFLLYFAGLTLESNNLTPMKKLRNRCVYLINCFWLNSDVIGGIYWFIDGIETGRTFVELTYIAPCITFSCLANVKGFFLIRYEDMICDLINNLRELGSDNADEKENEGDSMKKENVKFLNSVLRCVNVLNIVLLITFAGSPLMLIALKYYKTKEVEMYLPFSIIYPFDPYDVRYWPFVYVHQIWSSCIVLLNICGADYLLYVCCTYLGIQFRLLQHDIEHFVERNRVLLDDDIEAFEKKYVQLIWWHQKLIRLTGMLELIYSKSTLFNFVTSSLLICLTGFNVMAIEDVVVAVSFLMFLSTTMSQIYLLCSFGDFLMESSMEVSISAYNSKWYYLNAKSRKNLLIVLARAQKPCKLTAYGFSDVNRRAFMNILSTAWSYFALLKTSYSPPTK